VKAQDALLDNGSWVHVAATQCYIIAGRPICVDI
jgi:hypothetical protein